LFFAYFRVFPSDTDFFSRHLLGWFSTAELGEFHVDLAHKIQGSNACAVAFSLAIHEAGFTVELLMAVLYLKQ
jgi:hypothetical protein